MEETEVVTVFLRHQSDILLLRRSDEVGSYAGKWGAVAGHAEGDPDKAVQQEVREETGLEDDDIDCVRLGDPFSVTDRELSVRWTVHPYLFDCKQREVKPNWETETYEWAPPTAILRRETVPQLWQSYDSVRPTVETVAADSTHGSSYLSVRALEALRDEAAAATEGRTETNWTTLATLARDLRAARPSMTVVSNRLNRVMSGAVTDGKRVKAVEQTATAEIERAHRVKQEAATVAAEYLDGKAVGTLSRSGTVLSALERGDPASVLLAESRPGREGVAVAEEIADDLDVTLTTDAGFPSCILDGTVDVLLVGADTVLADGRVCNKVGTAGAAVVANTADVPVYVVSTTDKISHRTAVETGKRDGTEVYDGEKEIAVENPTFDVTPATAVDAVLTEDGPLGTADVRTVARQHATLSEWE